MGPEQFEFVRSLLLERSGLVVTPEKMYLLETRLFPVARKYGCKTIEELVTHYTEHRDEAVATDISEAMNTHESLFFRDIAPFDLFKKTIVPELIKRRAAQKKIRVWCAACSSGQEPYSLTMVLDDLGSELEGWQVDIIATDISHSVLRRAAEGAYTQFEVQRGLPVQYLVKHFTQEDDTWRLSSNIRKRVKFQHFNLLSDPRVLGKFDVIFCRNVLIYFDLATKTKVLDRMVNVLAPDGVLFLGSSESTIGITDKFWPVVAGRGVYKHTGGAPCVVENSTT